MKKATTVAVISVCLVLSAGATGGGSGDRKFDALAKRVSKLEKETTALKKTIASLEKTLSDVRKDASAVEKASQSGDNRSITHALLLAEWMDEYHRHKGRGRFHRDEIARRK